MRSAAVALLSLLAFAAPTESVNLRVQPKVAHPIQFRTTLAQEQINATNGIEVVTAWATTQELTLRIIGRGDDDVTQAELVFDRIRGRMQLAEDGDITFDTAAPGEPPKNPAIAALVQLRTALAGESFPLRIGSNGAVKSVSRYAEVMRRAIVAARAGAPELATMLDESEPLATDEHAMSVFQGLFAPLPKSALEVGKTFDATTPLHVCVGGSWCVPFEQRLTLTAITEDAATFAFEGKLSDEIRTALETGMRDLRLLSARVDGVYEIDRGDGLARALDWRVVLELEITVGKAHVRQTRTTKVRSERITATTDAEPAAHK